MLRRSISRRAMNADDWLHKSVVNERIVGVQYAVRGKIPERAAEIKQAVKNGTDSGEKKLIECNIGNPQAIGNPYLKFPRDVLSLFTAPHLLQDKEKLKDIFKPDVITRTEKYINALGNTGGYTESSGIKMIRQNICEYIARRDKLQNPEHVPHPDEIYCTDGASRGVQLSLSFIHNSTSDGVLVPVPQYPLYSATLHLLGMRMCPYFLDENNNWDLNMKSLESAYNLATFSGTNIKAIVLINPGNPTGQVLSKETVCDVVDFARRRGLCVMADEVYQENIYDEKKEFYSVYRGFCETPLPLGKSEVPCFSYHSTSKGIIGECGRRGGFTHVSGMEKKEVAPLYNKLSSVNLCSNLTGQVLTDMMVAPPKEGEESYEEYSTQYNTAMNSYKNRAKTLVDGLRKIPGITSNPIEGAMYAFPQIEIPDAYRRRASKESVNPDFLWCMDLLENERVVVVPGSGFEQVPGTYHFRTTILPNEEDMADVVKRVTRHQLKVMEDYGPNSKIATSPPKARPKRSKSPTSDKPPRSKKTFSSTAGGNKDGNNNTVVRPLPSHATTDIFSAGTAQPQPNGTSSRPPVPEESTASTTA